MAIMKLESGAYKSLRLHDHHVKEWMLFVHSNKRRGTNKLESYQRKQHKDAAKKHASGKSMGMLKYVD